MVWNWSAYCSFCCCCCLLGVVVGVVVVGLVSPRENFDLMEEKNPEDESFFFVVSSLGRWDWCTCVVVEYDFDFCCVVLELVVGMGVSMVRIGLDECHDCSLQ